MKRPVHCANCGCDIFVRDLDRTEMEMVPENPAKQGTLDGTSLMHVTHPFMKCNNCGQQLPVPVKTQSETVTITLTINPKN